jgi:hypothetical protein
VKLQRSKENRPMTANEGNKAFSKEQFVVETQKTRGGIDTTTNEDTRPYKFGEFDILAVSMQPSTNQWSSFMYTVSNWLLPMKGGDSRMSKFQPVSPNVNEDWTNDFEVCVKWFRARQDKKIKF